MTDGHDPLVEACTKCIGSMISGLFFIMPPEVIRDAMRSITAIADDDETWQVLVVTVGLAPSHSADMMDEAFEIVKEEARPKLSVVEAEEGEDE